MVEMLFEKGKIGLGRILRGEKFFICRNLRSRCLGLKMERQRVWSEKQLHAYEMSPMRGKYGRHSPMSENYADRHRRKKKRTSFTNRS